MNGILADVLGVYVSVRDSATRSKAENFYHGFLSALLAGAGRIIRNFQSNREAGNGYVDILFCSGSFLRVGVVLELKHSQKPQDLEKDALEALAQIREKHYAKGFAGRGCQRIFGYGLAFHGKSCLIESGPLELTPPNLF